MSPLLLAALLAATASGQTDQTPPDMYCGDKNCYEVLGLTRDASKKEIIKEYRKLAGKWHPDRFLDPAEKEAAEKTFMQIAAAHDTLKDDESRTEYNYMLDHPEEMWANYYRFYRRRLAPKVDVRLVILMTLSVVSFLQYFFAKTNYEDAIKYLVTVPKYRIQATEIARNEGLLKATTDKKANRGKTKEQIREEEEAILKKVIEEKMDIQGGYAKPQWTDVICVQLVLLPYTAYKWAFFYGRWLWKFGVLREDYGEEEKLYVIRKFLKLSQGQFDSMPEHEHEDMLSQELWVRENFDEWKQNKDDEMRAKMVQSGRYKQMKRHMRNKGPDRMTFDDS